MKTKGIEFFVECDLFPFCGGASDRGREKKEEELDLDQCAFFSLHERSAAGLPTEIVASAQIMRLNI